MTKYSRKKFLRNTNRENQNLVVNLSCHNISFCQNNLLHKGLSFVPTPRNFDFLAHIEKSIARDIARDYTLTLRACCGHRCSIILGLELRASLSNYFTPNLKVSTNHIDCFASKNYVRLCQPGIITN